MPVMDNEKKTDEIFENEEEKRKQAIMNEQEHSENKTQKIVPFLNIKAEFHQNRIDTLNEKIAVREDKINRNKAKIEKLSDKAERLEDRNKMLKDTFGDNPVIKKIIESNEKKINAIRNEKIPKRQNKIKLHENKINQLSEKRNKIQHKFNRVAALSNVVKSFTVRHTTMRREIFTEAMDKLNAANTDCLKDKLTALQMQKEKLATEYNKPETSSVDKINLAAKIKAVNEKISNINDKISKLARPENQFTEKTEDAVDAAMKVTSDKVSEMPENFNIPDISESVIEAAETVDDMSKSDISRLAEDFRTREDNEPNIYENYSVDELINIKNDILNRIDADSSIVSNKYIGDDIRQHAQDDIAVLKSDLKKVTKALENISKVNESHKNVSSFKKINPDYYKSLAPDDRSVKAETPEIANKIMEQLDRKNIMYSAVQRQNGFTSVTVSKADEKAYNAIAAEIKTERAKQQINPDFYKKSPEKNTPDKKAPQVKNEGKSEKKPVYISRATLKKSAQRLKQSKSQEQGKSKSKKQELD